MRHEEKTYLKITGSIRTLRAAKILNEEQCQAIVQMFKRKQSTEVTVVQDTEHESIHVWPADDTRDATVLTLPAAKRKMALN